MKTPRLLSVLALLSMGACGSPRGNIGNLGDSDASTATDSPAPTDSPAAADSPIAADVPVAVDVPKAVDVPMSIDVPAPPIDVPMARCGDGTCDEGETCASCRADCASTCPPPPMDVPMARCGDGTCNEGETCTSCRADCASTCPPPPVDVPPAARCGDGTCNGTENCTSCERDCGSCMGTGLLTDPCGAGVPQGADRNCGWRMGVTLTCSPGRATMVGCSGAAGTGSLCQPSYGACNGDPVMRVCPDSMPCSAAMALRPSAGNFDDQCGTCPSAYVTCPASGQIHVLTGDFDSNQATQRGTCTPAAR